MRANVTLPTKQSLLVNPGTPLIHRDLSWLQFNERVLAEAQDRKNPLLERLKFLAISASNLDEFFMIRFASIARAILRANKKDVDQEKRLRRLRQNILEQVNTFTERQQSTLETLKAEFVPFGFRIAYNLQESDPLFAFSRSLIEREVLPQINPPEEYQASRLNLLENLQLALIYNANDKETKIWFRIPRNIPIVLMEKHPENGELCIFFLDDLLKTHLGRFFRIDSSPYLMRLTRDGDITVDLETEDPETIPDLVLSGIGSREKSRPLRMQCSEGLPKQFEDQIKNSLKLENDQLLASMTTFCLQGLWSVVRKAGEYKKYDSSLEYPSFKPSINKAFRWPSDVFGKISQRDLILHHPYDAFESYVRWIEAACEDKKVSMIQQTVYRMDAFSPVIEALKKAAKKKKIRVVIELRARFDELNNLRLADELRKAGVEVVFGLSKLKIHAKIALVTREEEQGTRHYTHLSTGNYNATTARQYEDLAILTADPHFGADADHFFEAVAKGEIPSQFSRMVAAPMQLRRVLLNLIKAETEAAKQGKPARIFAKVNALVDEGIIDNLYTASQAGVRVDLMVRGVCSLVPAVKNLSENIRVFSVVDRFLEHSRIYHFSNQRQIYLSSADWMPRNFFSRLELAFPILDENIFRFLTDQVIPIYLSDTAKAWELSKEGYWQRRRELTSQSTKGSANATVRSQFFFEELAKQEYQGTPLSWRN